MSIATPPSTTLSDPPSPTELPTSNLPQAQDSDEEPKTVSPSARRIIKTTTTVVTPIFMRPKPIYTIVATSLNPPMGIGFKGKLPWPGIRADMAFFKQITSHVPAAESAGGPRILNAVVMGRKTWESIPPKFRPLAGRLNVIITRGSSSELGARVLEEMKSNSNGVGYKMHQLLSTKVKARSKSKSTQPGVTTILAPSTSSSSPSQTVSPIMISQSLQSALSFLSSPASISLSPSNDTPTSAPPTLNPTETPSSESITIYKIFCIGGAEIYRQVLALSSHSPQTPTTPTGPGSETGTDTEGEMSDSYKEGEHFDVRILQTQIRSIASKASSSSLAAQDPNLRRKSRVEEPDFECDTFFPDLLPSSGSGVKSAKWRAMPQDKMKDWVDYEVELPQHAGRRKQSIQKEIVGSLDEESAEDEADGKELWLKDEKAGVEIRVVGWQRR